jgi:hypothetical protein
MARWATLRSIVFQYTLKDRIAIPFRDRMVLARSAWIAEEWGIWLGDNAASEWPSGRINQQSSTIIPRGAELKDARLNAAFTLLAVGNLMFYTERTPASRSDQAMMKLYKRLCLRQIWPVLDSDFSLPLHPIDNAIANNISLHSAYQTIDSLPW